jgi:hypothetical protein
MKALLCFLTPFLSSLMLNPLELSLLPPISQLHAYIIHTLLTPHQLNQGFSFHTRTNYIITPSYYEPVMLLTLTPVNSEVRSIVHLSNHLS